ncbi:hypothetical protein [Xylanimonas cellulosilytica]|uniref:hypothetical protein n=1 Tax=Xylanimonas cellulosilytica TaxID=186189 RepID=UPI00019BFC53|nr:hypothetical protein [Xylanimonas cellulosilytica]
MSTPDDVILDDATWSALTGPLARFALGGDDARCFPPDVCPFSAARDWRDPPRSVRQ